MTLTDDEKLQRFIIPLVIGSSTAIDDAISAAAQQMHDLAVTKVDSAMVYLQPRVETMLGKALTTEQTDYLRSVVGQLILPVFRNIAL